MDTAERKRFRRTSSRGGDAETSELVRRRACEKIQAELSTADPEDITEKCLAILQQNEQTREALRNKAIAAEEEFLERKTRLVVDGEDTLSQLESAVNDMKNYLDGLLIDSCVGDSGMEQARSILQKVKANDEKLEYLRWVETIQDQADRIRSSLACDAVSDATLAQVELILWSQQLQQSKCSSLVSYSYRTTIFWTRMIAEKLAQNLCDLFVRINYPRPPNIQKSPVAAMDIRSKTDIIAIMKKLFKIQLPEFILTAEPNREIAVLEKNLPIKYMILPLEKRFRFHFFHSEKTNRLDKPEWYFSQLLSWIRDYSDLVDELLRPVYHDYPGVNIRVEFVRGLALLGRCKFLSTVPALLQDKTVFAHAVDEVISFARILGNMGYTTVQKEFCQALLIRQVFDPWIKAETALAEERSDSFISAPNAWKCRYREDLENPEDLKIPECVEQFTIMLKGISERCEMLSSMEHQLEFVKLQLFSTEDFISSMKSSYEKEEEKDEYSCMTQLAPAFATATKHLHQFFLDYSNTTSIIQILAPSMYPLSSSNFRIAQELSQRLAGIIEDMDRISRVSIMRRLTDGTLSFVRQLVCQYGHQGWKSAPSVNEYLLPTLSPLIAELIHLMKTCLSSQKERLFLRLYSIYMASFMPALDDLFYSEVILRNSFSPGGASQLKFDVMNNLIVVLKRFCTLPNVGMNRLVEGCTILNMARGSAMLLNELYESLSKPGSGDVRFKIAKSLSDEMKIVTLSVEDVGIILRKRNDLFVD